MVSALEQCVSCKIRHFPNITFFCLHCVSRNKTTNTDFSSVVLFCQRQHANCLQFVRLLSICVTFVPALEIHGNDEMFKWASFTAYVWIDCKCGTMTYDFRSILQFNKLHTVAKLLFCYLPPAFVNVCHTQPTLVGIRWALCSVLLFAHSSAFFPCLLLSSSRSSQRISHKYFSSRCSVVVLDLRE